MIIRKYQATIFILCILLGLTICAILGAETPAVASPLTEITVVLDDSYPPFVFRGANGSLQGILVDEWQLWEEKTGIRVHLEAMDWGKARRFMDEGKAQVIDTIFFTEERAKKLDFSKPYVSIEVPIFFHKDIRGIKDVKSLQGFTVGVKAGDASIDFLKKNGVHTLQEYPNYESIVQAAAEHKCRIFCIDKPPALYYLYKMNIDKEYRHSAPLYSGQFHRAVHKGKTDILSVVEQGFAKISPEEREGINKKWTGDSLPLHARQLRYVFYALGILAVSGLILLLWNASLRRRVNQKTAQLVKTVEELEKSEEKYRSIFENAVEGIFQSTPEGRYRSVNPALAKIIYGYDSPEEMINAVTDIDKQIFASSAEREAFKRQLEANNRIENFEYRALRKDGRIIWASTNARCVRDHEGRVLYYEGNVVDITERKKADAERRDYQRRITDILDFLPDATLVIDVQGRVIVWNRKMEALTGIKAKEMIGKGDYEYALPFYGFRRPILIDLAMNPAADMEARYVNIKRMGDILFGDSYIHALRQGIAYLSATASLLRNSQGEVVGAIECVRDNTERKMIEIQISQAEKQYRDLVDNTPVGVYRTNISGDILYTNQAFVDMFGYESPEELMPINVGTLYRNIQDRNRFIEDLKKEGKLKNYELELVGKNGQRIFALLSGVIDDVNVSGTLVDITYRKRVEEQLIQAQKMEAIGTLAGGIAHDFNNLLMGMQGYTSLMLMDLEPSHPHHERLLLIEDQIRSGANLTKQLLGFARGGRYDVKPVNMNDIIAKTSSIFSRTKKEITIHNDLSRDLLNVEVDQGQMEQVFMNLFVNAWQAMPGSGEIYLQTQNVTLREEDTLPNDIKPGDYINISVTDTGMGMDEKTKARIFDPFFTTKIMGRGTGLGLAVVYGIIKGHGGMINVYSEPGHGTTFKIYLPASGKAVVEETATPLPAIGGTETILLVDDEPIILDVNRELLAAMGYQVHAAASGQEAIAVYMEKKNSIDMVILDMVMPGLSGGETFDRLKEINPGVKVLLSSGYSLNIHAQEILDRGCLGFLQKPFRVEKLLQKVREILNFGGGNAKTSLSSTSRNTLP
jgi:two-component system, cell cycle sensor histidine kinase and response regulator CckA